jgi:hypothetical protein
MAKRRQRKGVEFHVPRSTILKLNSASVKGAMRRALANVLKDMDPASSKEQRPDIWPGMPYKDWRIAGKYLREIADKMGLRDWELVLSAHPCDEEYAAQVCPVEGQRFATFRLRRDWIKRPEYRKRQTMVHELMHCHFHPVDSVVKLDILPHLASAAKDIALAGYVRNVEYAIDNVATVIADSMPTYPGHTRGDFVGNTPADDDENIRQDNERWNDK